MKIEMKCLFVFLIMLIFEAFLGYLGIFYFNWKFWILVAIFILNGIIWML